MALTSVTGWRWVAAAGRFSAASRLTDRLCQAAHVLHLLQIQSFAVSVQTLCAIAVERYFAICKPLKTRITNRKVSLTILIIWLIATIIALPAAIFIVMERTFRSLELANYLTHCKFMVDDLFHQIYHLTLVVTLYVVPMLTMGVFYTIISHHLWHVKVPGVSVRSKMRSK
ncbi:hypothetical protein C0Q70_16554 [Pomacea canaliculata]|uniref:G-protein coupled receptors family 1 profile domain-containing protein n=1 Tax=Pomacea canaliculata TaxID=400727 RepID=A0A2T7NQ41_POMCA|nr:hypothetical protein C0Q70_16554 [Pomacea canaliculata]